MSYPSVHGDWRNFEELIPRKWTCGFCASVVSEKLGWKTSSGSKSEDPVIVPCPHCKNPTYFNLGLQNPGSRPGDDVEHVPTDVSRIYDQARDCCKIGAWDAAALLGRSLLMNIAVSKGANEGEPFVTYVNFLEAGHFTPPDSKEWIDHIRKQGNRAAHDVSAISKEDAMDLIYLNELILRYVYEASGRLKKRKTP